MDKLEDTIEPIIKLIEENPEVDFGNPGSLIHYLDSLNDESYEILLIKSLKRKPTEHTLFMFNRIINSKEECIKGQCISILESLINSQNMTKELEYIVKGYLSFQKNGYLKVDNAEEVDIVLTKKFDNKGDLIKIKKIFGLDESIKDLLELSKNIPFTIVKTVPIGRARKKVKELGSISEKIQLINLE